MSVFKIEQDIKLLEEKLEEVNITVADPIERNEYKKELQRKIKKLNRTKNSLELLHKEQQDLESLKLQVSTKKEKHENESSVKRDREIINKPQLKTNNNEITADKQSENDWQASRIKNSDDWENDVDRPIESDWDTPSNVSFNSWHDDSYKGTSVVDLENTTQMQTGRSISQTSHQIYLSKREVWISTVFALLSFIIPYIYTRRWKPFCIVFILLIFFDFILVAEGIFVAASFISAIDNGIAINKSKSKLKTKSS